MAAEGKNLEDSRQPQTRQLEAAAIVEVAKVAAAFHVRKGSLTARKPVASQYGNYD